MPGYPRWGHYRFDKMTTANLTGMRLEIADISRKFAAHVSCCVVVASKKVRIFGLISALLAAIGAPNMPLRVTSRPGPQLSWLAALVDTVSSTCLLGMHIAHVFCYCIMRYSVSEPGRSVS